VDRQAVKPYPSAVELLRCSLGFSYDTPTIPISAGSAVLILFTKTMNLSCFECGNEDSAMSSPSPPPRKPRADRPEDLNDVMPIPFCPCAIRSEFNEDPDEASLSSQTFLEMICYFFGDFLSRVSGKRQQSDQEFRSMMVTPAPSEHEMRDDVSGGVYTTPNGRGDYPRPKRRDWVVMDEGMESLGLVPQAQTVVTPPPAAQHDLKPRETLMDRFSHPRKKPIIISEQDVTDDDVLCGRDSRGSKHKGNVFYRDVVGKKRSIYKGFAKRQKKTDLSTFIIEDVMKGRFLTKHKGKQYRVFTWAESRKKVSQSLRENPRRKK
jgi:hypothetical protein